MKMRINTQVTVKTILVLVVVWFCAGAQEFPIFRMDEFDAAKEDDKVFVDTPEVYVPPVIDRPRGDDEFTLLPVTNVVIEGVVPYPEFGITQELIQAEIDRVFRDQRDIELDDNGFTSRDLDDIGTFLRDIIDRGGYDQDDLDKLVLMIRTQEVKRGWITVQQLDVIARVVTEYYRERGFILATAYVPEQNVEDGIIRLNVLEGRLGNVTVSNNTVYANDIIKSSLTREIGEPVTAGGIDSALRRINAIPGVRVRGSFSPGQNVGETSLNLSVLDETSWVSNVIMDNYGSETTGETRLRAQTQWLNIRKKGHHLTLAVLRTEGPDSSLFGLVEYAMPVTADGRGRIRANINSNEFTVGASIGIPEITGETVNYSISGSYQFLLSRTEELRVQSGLTFKDILFDVGGVASLSTEQEISTFNISASYKRLWDEQLLLFVGAIGVDQGHIMDGELLGQSTDFTKTLVSLSLLKRFSGVYNWFTKNESAFNVVFKANAQYSETFLSSVEQFSLGGPTAVRAFSVSDVSVDSGVYAGFEIYFNLPIDPLTRFNLPIEPLKPFLFYDYAYGVARRPGGGDEKDAIIKGYGLGLSIKWPGMGFANLIFARPQSTSFDDNFLATEGESRIYFELNYQVR